MNEGKKEEHAKPNVWVRGLGSADLKGPSCHFLAKAHVLCSNYQKLEVHSLSTNIC